MLVDVNGYKARINIGFFLNSERPGRSSGSMEVIKRIYVQNGIRGLFTGLTPRLVKVAPACAIMIATFEHGKRFFQAYNANQLLELEKDVHLVNDS